MQPTRHSRAARSVVVGHLAPVHGGLGVRGEHVAVGHRRVRDPVVARLHARLHLFCDKTLAALRSCPYTRPAVRPAAPGAPAQTGMTSHVEAIMHACTEWMSLHVAYPCTACMQELEFTSSCTPTYCMHGGGGQSRTVHSTYAMASDSAGEPLPALNVPTPAKRSAPGGKRCRKCCAHAGAGNKTLQSITCSQRLAHPSTFCVLHLGLARRVLCHASQRL